MGSNIQLVYTPERLKEARKQMVEEQLFKRDIADSRVLRVMGEVPREAFVNLADLSHAYADYPLAIEEGQTISQPYIVAKATASLQIEPHHRVLEIGSGCGYQAAVLAGLAQEVVGIEYHATLAKRSQQTLSNLGIKNITIYHGDGKLGFPQAAPFDRILLSCAAREIAAAWDEQLAFEGIIVAPMFTGRADEQILFQITREGGGEFRQEPLCYVKYVPLL